MGRLDFRALFIPLFLYGAFAFAAGVLGLSFAWFDLREFANTSILAATGTLALAASLVMLAMGPRTKPAPKVEILEIPHDPSVKRSRRGIVIGATALVLLLAVAVAAGGTTFAGLTRGDDPLDTAGTGDPLVPVTGLLDVEEFSGSMQGAMLPFVGGVGGPGTTTPIYALSVPANTTAYRLELTWDASGTGAAQQLEVRLEAQDGNAWTVLGATTGASVVTLDVIDLAPGAVLRAVASIPEGSGSTPISYTLYASAFAGTIPADHSALPSEDAA